MDHSESITNLAAALVEAHAEVQNAVKDSTNPHFKSNYASLNSLVDTVKPVFLRHGLAIVQFPAAGHEGAALRTTILHESGEYLTSLATCPVAKADPQGVGSAITYLRRYTLAALAQIGQDDDDGNAASYAPGSEPDSGGLSYKMKCPVCESKVYDNRPDKARGLKARWPDLKCSDKACEWAVWLDSWVENIAAEADAARKAGLIEEKVYDRILVRCADHDADNLVKIQRMLNELNA